MTGWATNPGDLWLIIGLLVLAWIFHQWGGAGPR